MNTRAILSSIAATFLLLTASSSARSEQPAAKADLLDANGKKIGSATFTETEKGVRMKVQASNLEPGTHGIHFHQTGKCDTPAFKTAGEHFNPEGRSHGLKHPQGAHEGDLPNLKVAEDGTASFSVVNPHVTLGNGKASLFKKGGTSLVIHSKADDHLSQPSGDSGDRIACGVIQKTGVGQG